MRLLVCNPPSPIEDQMLILGITGTRLGLSGPQRATLEKILLFYREKGGDEFHQGDCLGVDAEAATLARELGYTIVSHPPDRPKTPSFLP